MTICRLIILRSREFGRKNCYDEGEGGEGHRYQSCMKGGVTTPRFLAGGSGGRETLLGRPYILSCRPTGNMFESGDF